MSCTISMFKYCAKTQRRNSNRTYRELSLSFSVFSALPQRAPFAASCFQLLDKCEVNSSKSKDKT